MSVVVPTHRRPEGLARVLDALSHQADPGTAWEVVVVHSASPIGASPIGASPRGASPSPSTAAPSALGRLAERGVPLEVLHEAQPGAALARNRGLSQAAGEVVAFLDDDVVPARDWLARLVRPVLEGTCDGAGGPVRLDPAVARPRWFNAEWMAGYLAEVDLGDTGRPLAAHEWLVSANAAFRRSLLQATGGFDVALGPRGTVPMVNDDVELSRRLLDAGAVLAWVPTAVVVHELPEARLSRRYLLRRLYAQGRSDWLMDRSELAQEPWAGLDRAWARLVDDLALRRSEGLWHRPVIRRAIGELALFAGMASQSARHLAHLPRPG